MAILTDEQIAKLADEAGPRDNPNGVVSAVGEYTPQEFWDLLDTIASLQQRLAEADRRRDFYLDAAVKQNRAIEQTLGKVLNYPWYKDDQENFPGTTEADGVFIGEHVGETIAIEAAKQLAGRDARIKELDSQLAIWKDLQNQAHEACEELRKQLADLRSPSPCGVAGHTIATFSSHLPNCECDSDLISDPCVSAGDKELCQLCRETQDAVRKALDNWKQRQKEELWAARKSFA